MNQRLTGTPQLLRYIGLATLALFVAATLWVSGLGNQPDPSVIEPEQLDPAVQAVWEPVDSPDAQQVRPQAWVWGASPVSTSVEHYRESPDQTRRMVYFDKGRLDIIDPQGDPNSIWYAQGALLVSEMLAGRVQFGQDAFVEKAVPLIPVTGDLDQPNPVSYASLAPHSAVNQPEEPTATGAVAGPNRFRARVGVPITSLLLPDGSIVPGGAPDSTVLVGTYDGVLGYNVAAPFADWAAAQPYPELYLLGHPLSEPYWIDTQVGGQPARVLIQAFERRVLTYTPENPAGWRVESANVGLHYRQWRELSAPTDPALIPLARGVPFGEEIVGAALAHGLDPFLLAAVCQVASSGDPFLSDERGRRGLAGISQPAGNPVTEQELADPLTNLDLAAATLKAGLPANQASAETDPRPALASYYAPGGDDPAGQALVEQTLAVYQQLKEAYPPLVVEAAQHQIYGGPLSAGPAAYYDPSYDVAWWEKTLLFYQSIGVITPGWQPDPNGYYCVRPGYWPGERLRLTANGVTLECTVGDMVADRDLHGWINISGWAVELSWPTFVALGLDQNNWVQVEYPGDVPNPVPPIPAPEPTPSPTPSVTPETTPSPTPEPEVTPTQQPATPTDVATEVPPAPPSETPVEPVVEPSPTVAPEPPVAPTETPVLEPAPAVSGELPIPETPSVTPAE